jgi:hypothetical protein
LRLIDTTLLYMRPKPLTRPTPAEVVAKTLAGGLTHDAGKATAAKEAVDAYKASLAALPANSSCAAPIKAELVKAEAALTKLTAKPVGDEIQSLSIKMAKARAEEAEQQRAAKAGTDKARVEEVNADHLEVLKEAIYELTQLKVTVENEYAATALLWQERESSHVAFFDSVRKAFDEKIPTTISTATTAAEPPAPSVTAPSAANSTAPAAAEAKMAQLLSMQEVDRQAALTKDMVLGPRADYGPEALAVLNGLHLFYQSVDNCYAQTPACSFKDVGITPSVAWDLVGNQVWVAFYKDQIDEVTDEWMVPGQLHILMRVMLKEAALQVTSTQEAKDKAAQVYIELAKGSGKGGRYSPW